MAAGFIAVLAIVLLSFLILRTLFLDVATRQTEEIISSSAITGQLSKIYYNTEKLSRSFQGTSDLLEKDAEQLTAEISDLIARTEDPHLKAIVTDFSHHIDRLISQYHSVNTLLKERNSIDLDIATELKDMENLVGDQLIEETLSGNDPSYAEQLLTLVISFKENLLEIAVLHGEMVQSHYRVPQHITCPVTAALDNLFLRIQTTTAASSDIADLGEMIKLNILRYRDVIAQLHTEIGHLADFKNEAALQIDHIGNEFSMSAKTTREQIKSILNRSAVAATLLSLLVIIMVFLIHSSLIKDGINKPMRDLLDGIKPFGDGNFSTPLNLKRKDEWLVIEKGMNSMAAALRASYSSLQNSEERFRDLADLLPQPVFETDGDNILSYSNQRGYELFGYQEDDLKNGLNINSLFLPISKKNGEEFLKSILTEHANSDAHELTALKKDGSTFPVLLYMSPIFQGGKRVGARGIVVDISERKKAETILQKKEQFQKDLLNDMLTFVAVLDTSGEVLFVNNTPLKVGGLELKDVLGKKFYDARWWTHSDKVRDMVIRDVELCLSGKTLVHDVQIQTADDSLMWIEYSMHPIFDEEGRVQFMIPEGRDITDRKNADKEKESLQTQLQQAQKMEAVGRLAGGIAHDFNNILSAIVGFGEFISKKAPSGSEIADDAEEIIRATDRASKLVKQILTFSRLSDIQKHPIQPHLIVKEALKMLRSTLPSSIAIIEDIDPECGTILANSTNIHQIVVNLCTNARQAMAGDKGTLRVSLGRQTVSQEDIPAGQSAPPGDYIFLRVGDTGSGIPEDVLPHIFEPYFSTKEFGEGSGLGLSVVHGIIMDCKGFSTVTSEAGKGTTISVCFPTMETLLTPPVSQKEPPLKEEKRRKGKILVVDDEPLLLRINKKRLEECGHTVEAVTDGSIALETFQARPDDFDLLITDQTMPGLTGEELSRAVLEIKPALPIIMCTGHSETVPQEKALSMGIARYICKPLHEDELLDAVQDVLAPSTTIQATLAQETKEKT
ncbi:MAG: PAS domain S-box protein [Thermodesulfobacteriota bacterium]